MLNTAQEISSLLKGSFLENRQIKTLTIPQSPHIALTMAITQTESLEAWQLLRSRSAPFGRSPIW